MALRNMTTRAPTLAELQAQLQQANNITANWGSHDSRGQDLQGLLNNQNRSQQLAQQISQMQGGSAGGGVNPELQADLDMRRKLTEGRAIDLENDPYNKSANDFLQGVVGGQNVPYTNEVQNALLAQQGKGFSDAEASSMEALRQGLQASGGSIYDPSYQAASREAMSNRQGQNLDAAGRMASQAGLANFDARMSGAGQLSASRNAQNAQINQMDLAGAAYRNQAHRQVEGGAGGVQQAMAIPVQSTPSRGRESADSFSGTGGGWSQTDGFVGPRAQTTPQAPATPPSNTGWLGLPRNVAQQPAANYIRRVNPPSPETDPEGDYQNREQYPYSY